MKFLYRLYQLLIFFPLFVVVTIFVALLTSLGCMVGLSRWFAFLPTRFWGWFTIRFLFLPVKVEGREHLQPGQSYIFAANHQGAFDIFLLSGFLGREFKWMMKASLRKVPFVGMACEKAGYIFVDKSSRKAVAKTMDDARQRLVGGTSLAVFPEGARTFSGHMGIFRRGAFQLADELQLPVVPITIDGCFDVMPRTKDFHFAQWHPLRLVIHPPIVPTSQGAGNIKRTLEESYRIIMDALPERHQGFVQNDDQ
jgi:putative 1-acyl-sn-glycerol-3-phosphate acetyltransferase